MPGHTLVDRVRQLIQESGQTQEAFGASVGLDPTKLSKALNDRRRFSSLELARMADATGVTVDWLLTGEGAGLAARVSADNSSIGRAVAEATKLAESRDNLNFLGVSQEWPKAPALSSSLWIEQGSQLADFALGQLGPPSAFDSSETFAGAIERAFGIDVRILELDGGCDGLALWTAGGAQILLVSATENATRQRFTMAHELAHLLSRDDQALHIDENVMAGGRKDASEVRANAFAACLLMPEAVLRQRFEGGAVIDKRFAEVVMELKVSPSSLAWRLFNLKLVDPGRRAELGRLRTIDCAATTGHVDAYAAWVENSSQGRIPVKLLKDLLESYLSGAATLRPLANLMQVPVEVLRDAIEPDRDGQESYELLDYEP